jgi:hypothetical protein
MNTAVRKAALAPVQVWVAVIVALLSAATWFGWLAWDTGYTVDAATGQESGPYEVWQVLGAACSLAILTVIAAGYIPPLPTAALVAVPFAVAAALTFLPADPTGQSGVGVLMIGIGTFIGALALAYARAALTGFMTRRSRRI